MKKKTPTKNNPVAKNSRSSGSGPHKDKKAAEKRGESKYKNSLSFAEHLAVSLNQKLQEEKNNVYRDEISHLTKKINGLSEALDDLMHQRDNYDGEYDDEVGMIHNDLDTIMRVSTELSDTLEPNEKLPVWVIEKIAQAKGMLVNVVDYIISNHEEGEIHHTRESINRNHR